MAKRKRTPSVPLLLPHPADKFVGRRAELDELVRFLQPGQTVTLVGEPGIGKRALAAAAIDRMRVGDGPPRPFPAGVVTLSCSQYPNDHLLLSALARALGGSAYPDLRASVAALLGDKPLLIVLEDVDALSSRLFEESNYQQISLAADDEETGAAAKDADAAGDRARVFKTLHSLLDNGHCAILLTMTDPDLAEGAVIELGPLTEAEGRALLDYYSEDVIDNLGDSTHIVQLLGGLPLSLTLAGYWLAWTDEPVAELRRLLEERQLAELSPDARRDEGLAAVVQLTMSGFDRDARMALRLLALLADAPLPAPMVSAIVSPLGKDDSDESDSTSDEMIEAALASLSKSMSILAQLVEKGLLVEQDGSLQHRHYLVQQLAVTREDDRDAAQEFANSVAAMIDHLLMFAEMADEKDAAHTPGLSAHLMRLQGVLFSLGNWSYACDIAVRSAAYFTLPAYWYELFDVTRLACRAVHQWDDAARAGEYRLGIGLMLERLELTQSAAAMLAQALDAAEESGDDELALEATEALLQVHMGAGDSAAARQFAERLLALAERQDAPNLLSHALAILAQMLVDGEDKAAHLPRAIELTERALELQRGLGDQEGLLDAILSAGVVWSKAGDAARAREYGEQAVEMARRLRNRVLEAAALLQLGETYSRHGEPRRALRTYEKALEAARRGNVKPLIALSSWRLANSVEQSGNSRAALKYYEQCLAVLDPAEVREPTPAEVQAKIAALRG